MENTIDQVEVFKSTLVNKSKDELIQILMTLDPSVTIDSLKTSWGEVVSRYALIQRIVRALNLSEVKKVI